MARSGDAMVTNSQDSTTQRKKKGETDDKPRGRRRSRAHNKARETSANGSETGENGTMDDGHSSDQDGPSRKRRRSRKGLDKKFECPQDGCGKSYSRAEHLYRHQLNHTPKQIFKCNYPDCPREFVRQDLCNRHRERHTAKGSQLQRKDSMLNSVSPATDSNKGISQHGPVSPETARPPLVGMPRTSHLHYQSPQDIVPCPLSPATAQSSTTFGGSASPSTTTEFNAYQHNSAYIKRSNSDHSLPVGQAAMTRPTLHDRSQRNSFGVVDNKFPDAAGLRGSLHTTVPSYGVLPSSANNQPYHQDNVAHSSIHSPFVPQQNLIPYTLPPSGFSSTTTISSPHAAESSYTHPSPHAPIPVEYPPRDPGPGQQSGADMGFLDQMVAPNTMPVFGGEGYSRSPFVIPEDFVAFLFSGQQFDSSAAGQPGMSQQGYTTYFENPSHYQPYSGNDSSSAGYYPPNSQHPMAVNNLLDTNLPETELSVDKSQEIIDLIKEHFNETERAPVSKQSGPLLDGDREDDDHMMSRKMMQTYIGSFWLHFHPQLPILHKPTFSPDKTQNLLLIAMMAIGASCLDKVHGRTKTEDGSELSNFLAWHLRWAIFKDNNFRPPAKLWVFQALLLLEVYEKMYSSRELHERAHIHHATTLTLMRRGSSLIGRSALDSPPSVRDDKQGPNNSRQSPMSGGTNTPNEWWNHWITNEATRRAAFAAFVIDSTHATMFGHSTVMVAHEMRLPLPCDEAMWSATSGIEVARIEASLLSNGVKQISFLEGLKRTLGRQEVRTNAFGRSILMAGLLSVTWHMNQRDLQVNSLGVSHALGGRDKWRGSLTRAFDTWKQDFDRSLAQGSDGMISGPYIYSDKQDENVVFESRTVLHHLAHMAMHVDIVDCQIFARAKRLLGRTIGPLDLSSAQRRMRDMWAPTAKARDATFYALRFLCTVLLPEDSAPNAQGINGSEPVFQYSARDDVLMNRSWVLYFAALIVWCYGFALEGPTSSPILNTHTSEEDQVRDMRAYLRKLGTVVSPDDLKTLKGFNGCSGMLMVLRRTFQNTRWELLHEAADLLTNCIRLIGGSF